MVKKTKILEIKQNPEEEEESSNLITEINNKESEKQEKPIKIKKERKIKIKNNSEIPSSEIPSIESSSYFMVDDNKDIIKKENKYKKEELEKLEKQEKPEKPEKPEKLEKQKELEELQQTSVMEVEDLLYVEDEILKSNCGTKKRGRKPKGGKIVLQILPKTNSNESKPNIILHLKCSMKDIQNDLFNNNNKVESYHFPTGKNDLNYEIIIKENDVICSNYLTEELENKNFHSFEEESIGEINMNVISKNNDLKQIWKKLKQLEYNLHINNVSDKKSACFWCTYDFDNPPIYIPKHYIKDSYHVYGCFCSPECATAFLMEENIDSSAKFERYQLLNNIYSKIYDYNVNIKPSPNPYYMLEKYYGNLSIQEYRSLLKNERLFLIVDKPLTRILPELHEDNDDFIINNKIIPSSTNNLPVKGKLRKKIIGKNTIVNEKFGLS